MLKRRDFIKVISMLGGIVLTPLGRLIVGQYTSLAQVDLPIEGELYAGFVLLPEGAPVPAFVQPSKLGLPNLCSVGDNAEITGVVETFTDVSEIISNLYFPVYTLKKSPDIYPAGGYILKHKSGEVSGVALGFLAPNASDEEMRVKVALWAQPDFSNPLPLWSSEPMEFGGPAVVLEKVDFLPTTGIVAITPYERVFHWIENKTYYTCIVKGVPRVEEARKLVDLLYIVQ